MLRDCGLGYSVALLDVVDNCPCGCFAGGQEFEDPTPDRIANRLSGGNLQAQIFDEPGIPSRNAVIACVPERQFARDSRVWQLIHNDDEAWVLRKPRSRHAEFQARAGSG